MYKYYLILTADLSKSTTHVYRGNDKEPLSIFVQKAGAYYWASAHGYALEESVYFETSLKLSEVSIEGLLENPQWWYYPKYYQALISSLI